MFCQCRAQTSAAITAASTTASSAPKAQSATGAASAEASPPIELIRVSAAAPAQATSAQSPAGPNSG